MEQNQWEKRERKTWCVREGFIILFIQPRGSLARSWKLSLPFISIRLTAPWSPMMVNTFISARTWRPNQDSRNTPTLRHVEIGCFTNRSKEDISWILWALGFFSLLRILLSNCVKYLNVSVFSHFRRKQWSRRSERWLSESQQSVIDPALEDALFT